MYHMFLNSHLILLNLFIAFLRRNKTVLPESSDKNYKSHRAKKKRYMYTYVIIQTVCIQKLNSLCQQKTFYIQTLWILKYFLLNLIHVHKVEFETMCLYVNLDSNQCVFPLKEPNISSINTLLSYK